MAEQALEILVNLIKRGEGAKIAAEEVRALDTATKQLNASQQQANTTANAANVALTRNNREVAAVTKSYTILSSTVTGLAASAFPQLGGAIFAVQGAMQSANAVAQAQGKNFSALTVGTLGVTAALTAGVAAWNIYRNAVDDNVREAVSRGEALLQLQEAVNFRLSEQEKIEMRLRGRQGIAADIRALGGKDAQAGAYEDAAGIQAAIENARLRQREAEAQQKREAELTGYGGAALRGKLGGAGASEAQIRAEELKSALGTMQVHADQWYAWQISKEEEGTARFEQLMEDRKRSWEYYTREAKKMNEGLYQDMFRIGQQGQELFSSGLAGAIVGAFRDGEKAFQQFAANFFAQMAEMILQALILRSIQGIFGASLPGVGGIVTPAAEGGVFPRMMAGGGFAELNQATYFPDYNVVAGEAGREIMAVLAKPRAFAEGGLTGMVGEMEGRRVALTDADELAGRGGGGIAQIIVQLSPELRAAIVEESIKGARVTVAQDLTRETPISRAARSLNQSP